MLGVTIAAWLVICGIRAAHLLDFVHKQRVLAFVVVTLFVFNAVAILSGLSRN